LPLCKLPPATAHYLNNRVFLSRNHRPTAAPRKSDALKTSIFAREAKLRGQICQFQEHQTSKGQPSDRKLRDINTLLSLSFTTKFSSARQFKIHIELFSTFLDESRERSLKPNVKCEKENRQKPTYYISTVYFL